MKRIFLALFTVAFIGSIYFTAEAEVLATKDNVVSAPTQTSTTAIATTGVASAATTSAQTTASVVPSTTATTVVSPILVTATTTAATTTAATTTTTAATTLTGKVDMVSYGNSMSGTGPQIIVKDDSGKGTTFTLASDVTIIGKDGKPATFNWLSKDDKVVVEYAATQGDTKTAKSIKVLSNW